MNTQDGTRNQTLLLSEAEQGIVIHGENEDSEASGCEDEKSEGILWIFHARVLLFLVLCATVVLLVGAEFFTVLGKYLLEQTALGRPCAP